MDCPKCNSTKYIKDGHINGRQRYLCKNCGRSYTVKKRSTEKSEASKHRALKLYLEGMGFRAIGRVLGINHVTIYYWIKKWGETVNLPKSKEPIEVVELDEIHTYIGNKKTTVGCGLLLTDLGNACSTLFVANAIRKPLEDYGKIRE